MKKLLCICCSVLLLSGYDLVSGQEPARVPPKVKPVLKTYELKPDLSNVENLHEFAFTDEQKAFIVKNHLLIYDGGLANPVSAYLATPVPFITSDIMLHVYHVLVSNTIEETERVVLLPLFATFLRESIGALKKEHQRWDRKTKAAAARDLVLLGVAAALLDEEVGLPDDVQKEVKDLTGQILNGGRVSFDGSDIDASLLKPRAGYEADRWQPEGTANRRKTGAQYFRAVMWLCQAGLKLDNPENLRALVLLAQIIRDNPKAKESLWRYDEILRFFAGQADGLAPDEFLRTAQERLGEGYRISSVADDQLNMFGEALKGKAAIRILGTMEAERVTAGGAPKRFFILPARYNLTGHLFQMILEGAAPMPSGLDYASVVLDSPEASKYSKAKTKEIREMADELNHRPEHKWYDTYEEGVQYSLRALVAPVPEGYPVFMRTDVWAKKSLNTALGGWVQLSHDLFLYQKHAGYYKDGGGGIPRFSGYVEPNPEFYSRLLNSVTRLQSWLKEEGIFQQLRENVGEENYQRIVSRGGYWRSEDLHIVYATERHYETLESVLKTLMELSRKELESDPFTQADHDVLKDFGANLRWLTFDVGAAPDGTDKSLICDLATDYLSRKCLEVAIGKPLVMVVIVPWDGKLYLSKGAILSYHEFLQPMGQRLTDVEWKNSKQSASDSWLGKQGLLAPALAEIHDPKVLEKYLTDENPNVRVGTARRLIELKAVESLPSILKLILDDTELPGQLAGRNTRYSRPPDTVSSKVYEELWAIEKMGEKGRQILEEFILSIGKGASVKAREKAISLAWRLSEERRNSPRILEYLEQRAADEEKTVRERAAALLKRHLRSRE